MEISMLRSWIGAAMLPLLLSGTAMAAQNQRMTAPPPPITVMAGHETMDQWTSRISRRLDNGLAYPRPVLNNDVHEGFVKVAFGCDEQGKPQKVVVLQSSGASDLDKAAMMAVKRISTLHPLPEGIRSERGFQAWILFSKDEDSFARKMDQLRQEARLANLANRQEQTADTGPVVLLAAR
jgi:periplasmic protein TonB